MTEFTFGDLSIDPLLLKAIKLLGYTKPTEVQQALIPAVLEGRDCIVKSRTGSGKTAAFAIPLCQLSDWEENKPQALVLTPTRELALQVREDIFNIGRFKRIKAATVYGKSPFHLQAKELKQKTHIVVATSGRLLDHRQRETIDVSRIRYLVIDEADEMLDMGFIGQIEDIISFLPEEKTTVLLSATIPGDVRRLCEAYLDDPLYIETKEENRVSEKIIQGSYILNDEEKTDFLKDLLVLENPESCIIFCNMKYRVDEVFEELKAAGYPCAKLHGGMEQEDRQKTMEAFKKGKFRFLAATDVAARGIDIEDISLIINYDLPQDRETYVHRIGRTGRIGKSGKALSLASPSDQKFLESIASFTGRAIPLLERPDQKEVEAARKQFMDKITRRPLIREDKTSRLNEDIMKIHINAGKKTKMRPVDIVGTICNIEGVTAEDIGVINILDVSTFVEILHGKGPIVLAALQTKPVKGRLRKVKDETGK